MLKETRPHYALTFRPAKLPAGIEQSLGQRSVLKRVALAENLPRPTEINIRWRDIIEGFVITLMVVLDECGNGLLKPPEEVMAVQTDDILQRAMITLDFTPDMRDGVIAEEDSQFAVQES